MDLQRYRPSAFGRARRTGGTHGYVAYFPAQIPRTVELGPPTIALLAEAEAALGRLAGVGDLIPNPHLLIRPYVLREAVSSSRIEGTRASIADLLELEADGAPPSDDVEEVLGYVDALQWGLQRMDELPLSIRLMREMHRRLLDGKRGRDRLPGELRRSQNWIGGPGSTIESATFVPPPPDEVPALLADWEAFAHEDGEMPLLVRNALLHYQLETIHPFLDGNGRIGRLMIVFLLVARGRIPAPLLYVSPFFERERDAYYEALRSVSETGDAAPWIELFLRAVHTEAADAVGRARRIVTLRERYRAHASGMRSGNALALAELLCESPIVTAARVQSQLGVTRPTATTLLRRFLDAGVLTEGAPGPRGQRRYVAHEILAAVVD